MINVFEHDATPTWSGFIYQGRIAVYLAIKTMIELRNEGKILEIDKYTIEMEKCEDIAIVYKDENGNRKYSEYSRAVTPQIRQAGNRLSGLAETAYASLLA